MMFTQILLMQNKKKSITICSNTINFLDKPESIFHRFSEITRNFVMYVTQYRYNYIHGYLLLF